MSKPAIKILVDRSGSMAGMPNASQAIAEFLKERKTLGDTWISLSQFDDKYEEVYPFQSIANVPEYKLEPRGMTALNDAIAKAIKEIEDFRPGKQRDRYLVIMTDGYENASLEYSKEAIKELLEKKQAKGLKVIYLGANQDAQKVAIGLAIPASAAITYTKHGTSSALSGVSFMTSSPVAYAGGFSDRTREAAAVEDDE